MILAKKWLERCLQHHPRCQEAVVREKLGMPARLLQLGSPTPNQVRLWIRPEGTGSPRPRYTTLSHCWGRAKFLNLTSKNLQELTEGISISILPKTFRDAILVAKGIGAEYLWIDALCIVQDSTGDWEREA